jgi:hypothetical protein
MEILAISTKITARNKIFFGGHVIAAESFAIFVGHAKPSEVTLIFGR